MQNDTESFRVIFLEIATTSIILLLQSSFHTTMISIGHSFENDTPLKTRHMRLETDFVVQSHTVRRAK